MIFKNNMMLMSNYALNSMYETNYLLGKHSEKNAILHLNLHPMTSKMKFEIYLNISYPYFIITYTLRL